MAHWMCTNCGYHLQATSPPERCPGCQQACLFNNVTCYHPECGGEGNIDQLLVRATLKAVAVTPQQAESGAGPVMEALPTGYIFGSLTEEQRRRVKSLETSEAYKVNTIICKQGAEAHKLYLVEEGEVAVECELQNGKRIPISSVSAGGAFGWSALVRPYQFTATVVALSRTRVRAIEREALLALMRSDSRMGLLIMQDIASITASRLRNLELEMIGLLQGRR